MPWPGRGRDERPLLVRDATPADSAAVLAMNNAATPNVNALDETEWGWLVAHATYYRVAEDADGLAGFILCVPAGLDYWSLNYAWFTARLPDFLYLDRVVVAERARNRGVGTALYADLHATVAGRWPCVTLEVNLRPPNPARSASMSGSGISRWGFGSRPMGRTRCRCTRATCERRRRSAPAWSGSPLGMTHHPAGITPRSAAPCSGRPPSPSRGSPCPRTA